MTIKVGINGLGRIGRMIVRAITENKYKDITSAFMFLVALFILYQVFKLNLDFGLVLASATLFAAFAWTH